MKTSTILSITAVLGLACVPLAQAKTGFSQTETCTQGSSGHQTSCDTNNNGTTTTTTTTTGPYGQVKQGKSANTTTTSQTCGPGNSTGC